MDRRLINKFVSSTVVCTLLQLTSCQITKPYAPPLTETPLEWKNQSDQNLPEVANSQDELTNQWKTKECDPESSMEQARNCAIEELKNWWEIFEDPILNQLEEEAIKYNYDLLAAFERVLEARAIAKIDQSPLYPYVNFSPAYQRSQMLILSPISLPGAAATTIPPLTNTNSSSSSNSSTNGLPKNVLRFLNSEYTLPFNFQYEIDLWNKLHNRYYASVYRAQAATEDYYQVLLSLTSAVATNYFQLRDLDFQYEIVAKTLEARKKAFEINRDRYEGGLLNYLDVSRAEVQVANAESDKINIKRLRGMQENVIALLTGLPASEFSLGFNPLETPPPKIPAGLPSELLYRRPDILSAERLLAAAYADIGVAYADFFPSLNLTATIGLESPLSSILLNWKARMWQIGANVVQLVFDAGRTQANVGLAIAHFREQFNHYQETVLNAFKEVEDALVNLRERADQALALENSVKYAEQTYELSYFRYNRGLVTYLDVTDAERDLLQARQNFALVLGSRYTQTVALIASLGGGWGFICTEKKQIR